MTNSEYRQFIENNGVPRTGAAGGEWVLRKPAALEALKILKSSGANVLGGDVYEREEDGYFRPTYDNWFCTKETGEADDAFSSRSVEVAKNYVHGYNNPKLTDPFFVLVVD